MRARFWYCHYLEHFSFISRQWLSHIAAAATLRIERLERFSHNAPAGLAAGLRAWAMPGLYAVALALYRGLHRRFAPGAGSGLLPRGGGVTKDRMRFVLQGRGTAVASGRVS